MRSHVFVVTISEGVLSCRSLVILRSLVSVESLHVLWASFVAVITPRVPTVNINCLYMLSCMRYIVSGEGFVCDKSYSKFL